MEHKNQNDKKVATRQKYALSKKNESIQPKNNENNKNGSIIIAKKKGTNKYASR